MAHLEQRNAFIALKQIAMQNRKKLAFTFSLVGLENLLFTLYPLIGGFVINAILNGQTLHALLYAMLVLIIWGVGSARRAVDTRTFVKMYADLAVPVILNQKQKHNTSSAAAHATLARQFIDFFEVHLPILITSGFSVIGSVIMLLIIEFWSGIIALVILILFILILPTYLKINDKLYFKLNNRLENEVNVIERSKNHELIKHYTLLSRIRIAISNREALSYLTIGFAMAILFGTTLVLFSLKSVQAGHVYAVMTYLWGFAMSLDDMPRLAEKFSELKDIGKRVEI